MKKVVVTLFCLLAASAWLNAAPDTELKFTWKPNAKHLSGPVLNEDSFKGKVTCVVFWGRNCPRCQRALPNVEALNKKYAGKLVVVASHIQGEDQGLTDYLASKKYSFSVYQHFRLGSPIRLTGIPYFAVFDSKGYYVAQGKQDEIIALIPDLIASIPPADSLLASLNIKHHKAYESKLMRGKPVKTSLASLERQSTGSDEKAKEAKMIVDHVNKYIDTEVAAIVALAAKEPGLAYTRFMSFWKVIAGLPQLEKLQPLVAELKGYKYLQMIVQCRKDYDKLDLKSSVYKVNITPLVTKLNALTKRADASDAVKAEAKMIVARVNSDIDREVAEIIALAKEEPGHGYTRLMGFGRVINGLPQLEELRPVAVELESDKYLKVIVKCRKDYDRLDVKSSFYKSLKTGLVTKLNALIKRADASDAVKAEARSMLTSLG